MNECEVRLALCGAAAGAAGTTALNAVTYIDRAIRGRPSSSTPETTVETLSSKTHVPIPGGEVARQNRVSGLGPLSGLLARGAQVRCSGLARAAGWRPGSAVGAVAATAVAMVGTNGPMTLLGDDRSPNVARAVVAGRHRAARRLWPRHGRCA